MSLRYAILGLLTGGPMHGYAIGRELKRRLSGLWAVNPGQVYATLERLARDDLVAPAPAPAPPAAERRAADLRPFLVLPAGRRALRRWLDRPVGCELRRSPVAVRLAVQVWADDRAGISRLLAEHRARCATMYRLLESAGHGTDAAAAVQPGDDLDLVARAARYHVEAELDWLTMVEQVLLGARPDRVP